MNDLMEPMLYLNKKSTERQTEFKQYLEWIKAGQQKIITDFEEQVQLKDMVKDSIKVAKALSQ